MGNKKHMFSITSDGMLPYLPFPDLQSYGDSLSLKELYKWDERLSGKEVDPETIRAAMCIYCKELGADNVSMNQKEIEEICTKFSIGMGLLTNVRRGILKCTEGRLTLINDSAKFAMTEKGIKSVEAMFKKP
jgi:hypothetical protein